MICNFFVIKAAKKYFAFTKANSPFSKEASDNLRKFTKLDLLISVIILAVSTSISAFSEFTASTINVWDIIIDLCNYGLVFALLMFVAYLAERFEKLDENDVSDIKAVFSKTKEVSKKLTFAFVVAGAVSLVAAVVFGLIQAPFEIVLSDILFDGTSDDLPTFFACLFGTLLTLALAAKFIDEYTSKVIENGTIFNYNDLTLLKNRAIKLLLFPIILIIVFDIVITIIFDYVACDVIIDFAILIALAMALTRIMIYAKKEQLELKEEGNSKDDNTDKTNDPDSPFLN